MNIKKKTIFIINIMPKRLQGFFMSILIFSILYLYDYIYNLINLNYFTVLIYFVTKLLIIIYIILKVSNWIIEE